MTSINKVKEALNELRKTVLSIIVLHKIMDSLVVFMIFVLTFRLVKINWLYSFIPFGLYGIIHIFSGIKNTNLEQIEKKVPLLKEQLRTVADNTEKDNEITRSLNEDVIKKMKEIKNSYFIKFGSLTSRVFMLILTSFLIIFVSAQNVFFLDANNFIHKISTGRGNYAVEDLLGYHENKSLDDILGNKSVAELGYEKIDLKIDQVQSEVDISKIKDPEDKAFKSTKAKDIGGSQDSSYQESIPKNYQKIVQNYFKEITKER